MNKPGPVLLLLAALTACGVCLLAAAVLCLSSGLGGLLLDVLGSPVKAGQPAPDFSLPTAAGYPVQLSRYAGQPVLLTFHTTW